MSPYRAVTTCIRSTQLPYHVAVRGMQPRLMSTAKNPIETKTSFTYEEAITITNEQIAALDSEQLISLYETFRFRGMEIDLELDKIKRQQRELTQEERPLIEELIKMQKVVMRIMPKMDHNFLFMQQFGPK